MNRRKMGWWVGKWWGLGSRAGWVVQARPPGRTLCKGGKVRVDSVYASAGARFSFWLRRSERSRGSAGSGRDWLGRPPPPWSLCKVGSQRARVSLAQCAGDSAGLSGPHPPRPPFCEVGSQRARTSLAQFVSDSAGLSGPHPPWPPLCKGGKVRVDAVYSSATARFFLLASAQSTFARLGGERAGLVGRHPPPWSLCKVGSQRARVSLAQCAGDSAGLSGPHPPRPPFCEVGSQRARTSLAQFVSDSAGLSGPHPPWPPLCKGGKVRVDAVYSSATARFFLLASAQSTFARLGGERAGLVGRPPAPWPPLCKGGEVRVDAVYSSATARFSFWLRRSERSRGSAGSGRDEVHIACIYWLMRRPRMGR